MPIPRDEDEARRFVEAALAPWRDSLLKGPKGLKACLANAITAFRSAPEWAGVVHFDLFAQSTMLRGIAPWMTIAEDRKWTSADDVLATNWLQHQGIMVSPEIAHLAIETAARDFSFHPVLEYLNRIVWDRIPRLDTWAVDYLGVETTDFALAVSARFLISAVARVNAPGCKADCALILEGKQGLLKSTALKTLFHPWFSDDLAELGSKDAAMQLAGIWCTEMAELDSLKRSDVSRIKAFLSRTVDHLRLPYGRRVSDMLRQCVFAGTVNDTDYLRDDTGARRFWPLFCHLINIAGLAAVKDQLWAEARERYFAGEVWWLDDETLIASASVEQNLRRLEDPWMQEITKSAMYLPSCTPSEILLELGIPIKDHTQLDQNRVASCLKVLGWSRKMTRHLGQPSRRYFPP